MRLKGEYMVAHGKHDNWASGGQPWVMIWYNLLIAEVFTGVLFFGTAAFFATQRGDDSSP